MSGSITHLDLTEYPLLKSGKVREVFDLGDRLLFVATDRISAFDCILPTPITDKGRVLTQLSLFWFKQLRDVVKNHFITANTAEYPAPLRRHAAALEGRSMLVCKAQVLPVECVVRGYLAGSGWAEYRTAGTVCGERLPAGLFECSELPQPLFTPSTKAAAGHDENISFARMQEIVGAETAGLVQRASLALYGAARQYARSRGIIIADTKFEFGVVNGAVLLIDEVLTPDSSRFWPAEQYAPGAAQPSFDKQYVRDYLLTLDWNKEPPAPALPAEVVQQTRAKYLQALRMLTGGA